MRIIEQSAVVEENGGNSHVQNNTDQSTQTNNDNVANETDEDDNSEFAIPPDTSQEECQYCFCRPCITNEQNKQMWWHDRAEAPHQRNSSVGRASQMNKTNKCGGMIVQRPLTKEILL
jgi:hypothetical protein